MRRTIKLVYSPRYDITFYGIEKQHPFDSCKYSHAWKVLEESLGAARLKTFHIPVGAPVSQEALLQAHSAEYLASLKDSAVVARALEMPILQMMPAFLIDKQILTPMRFATQGTIIAAETVLNAGCDLVVNMSGGYHHASHNRGEGFSIYADTYIAIESLRHSKRLDRQKDNILYIDLDAHQGNGFERLAMGDPAICIFDMYNAEIYPRDQEAKEAIRYDAPLFSGTDDATYLANLEQYLPIVLQENRFRLAFYNAGTDPYQGDTLGRLNLTVDGILQRDRFVLNALAEYGIPCVMVLSGGYSRESYRLIANTLLEQLTSAIQ